MDRRGPRVSPRQPFMGCERLLPALSPLLRRSIPPEVVDSKQMDGVDSSLALPPHSNLCPTGDDANGAADRDVPSLPDERDLL